MAEYEKLMRLTTLGVSLVTDSFLVDPDASPISSADAVEPVDVVITLADVGKVIASAMDAYSDPHSSDAPLAVDLHKSLRIPRRVAMDIRMWHFLTCVAYPDYVQYRWGKSEKVTRERFLGSVKRNGLARLWWASEVMRTGDDYSSVAPCFESQDLYEAVFGRSFSKYPPAAKAFVNTIKGEKRKIHREVAKDFNFMLSTFVLEDLPGYQVENLITERIAARSN